MNLCGFFYKQPSSLTSIIFFLLKMLSFFRVFFWLICKKSGVHRCVNLCLDLQLDTIDQYISFSAIMMIFYYYSSIVLCEIWHDDTSSSSFIIQDCPS